MAQNELVFAPLGGIGEIGMNLSIYGFGDERRRQWLIVDCGVSFASEEHLPGVDLILPDIGYLIEERKNIVGLVLTHGHEDHMGALIDLWPRLKVPLFATPFTAALFEAKRLSEPGAPEIPIKVVPLGGRLTLGPFTIDFINVAHSIPESNALAIRTPAGIVLHTGDWKIDPTPLLGAPTDAAKLTALGDEGVLALVGDSTNAVREGRSPSESDVAKTLAELIRTAPRRVAVTTFASHVGRLRAVADAARAADREVVLVGRAMERVAQVARETGYLDGVQDFRSVRELRLSSAGQGFGAVHRQSGRTARRALAHCPRRAPGGHARQGRSGDFLLARDPRQREGRRRSHQRPGHAGDRSHYRPHPSRSRVRPSAPRRIARHDRLGAAENPHSGAWRGAAPCRTCRSGPPRRRAPCAGLPQRRSGSARPDGAKIIDKVPSGRLYKDGSLLVNAEGRSVAARRRLSFSGVVSVAMAINDKGQLMADPEVELIGVPDNDANGASMLEIARDAVEKAFDALPKPRRRDADAVAESIRRAVRGAIAERWNKKPICHVHVLVV